MSTALSPSSEIEPSFATDSVVIRLWTSSFTSKTTSTSSPVSSTSVTRPTSLPATRTGDPALRPATLVKRVFRL